MTQTPITELDFFQIKEQLKAYLRGQTRFKDYDFEGSNLSVLLDILAYNTYQNNFYTNMAISEMFLDSAQLESSVMSHAKELNYLPTSATSARAEVDLVIVAPSLNNAANIVLPAGLKFFTTHNGDPFNFYTDRTHLATLRPGSTGIYEINCLPIYEGELITETALLAENRSTISLSNENVDISSIRVFVGPSREEYVYRSSIFGVQPNDRVFYIEPTLTGGYGITFGLDTFGRQPAFNEEIQMSYRICSGDAPNGAVKFTTTFTYPTTVTTFTPASGGGQKESIESIKYFAPKSIQNQERAVTSKDYEALLRKQFGSSIIKSVSVYGGDEMDPPRYGKVAVSINPYSSTTISDSFKTAILSYLSDKTPLPIQPIFVDPEFMYARINLTLYYSKTQTGKTPAELESLVRAAIKNYSDVSLDDFGSVLRLSRLSKIIDDVDVGIVSNSMEANPIIDYSPPLILSQNPQFKFGSSLIVPYPFDENENIANYIPAIKSSNYFFNNTEVFFQDDGRGNIITLSSNLQTLQVLNPVIGTVDYSTGLLKLVNFTTTGYTGPSIKIYANTVDRNIAAPKSRVLSIRDEDITVQMVETNNGY